MIESLGLHRGLEMMHVPHSPFGIDILDAKKLFGMADACVRERNGAQLFVNGEIRAFFEGGGDFGKTLVEFAGIAGIAGNN